MATTTATETTVIKARGQEQKIGPVFPDVNTLRKAIPTHCFQPPVLRSVSYVVRDLLFAGGLVYAALTYIPALPNVYVRTAAWIAYGFAQGLVGTGIWILAHECGHGAFSLHPWFNDVMGFILHTILMVPYFSWKFSHARHHMFTGHMERDMVFVPATKGNYDAKIATLDSWVSRFGLDAEVLDDVPVLNLIKLVAHQTLGWPAYLLTNISAGNKSLQRPQEKRWWRLSHFHPGSVVFRPQEAIYILLTDLGLATVATALYFAGQHVEGGWQTICLLYLVPWFWVHHWLMAITYLHHTHEDVPHYDAENWTFVRGALATIDRDMGWIDRYLFHGIIGTHVVHHLFARIPFYYAEEATEAIKPLLPGMYYSDNRSFHGQLFSVFSKCKYVERDPNNPGAMKWHKEA